MKEITCLGDDLEVLISHVCVFDYHYKKASYEPSPKKMRATVIRLFPNFDKEKLKRTEEIACRDILEEHAISQKIAYILCKYGDTKKEVIRNIREHLQSCEICGKKYANYLDEQVENKLRLAQEEGLFDKKQKRLAEKVLEKGYLTLLREADIFGFGTKT